MAADPTSPTIQLLIQNTTALSVNRGEGLANVLEIQGAIPIPAQSWFPFSQSVQPDIPIVTTAGPDRITALGDINVDYFMVPDSTRLWSVGAGFTLTMPTATSERTGLGKWLLGPAVSFLYYGAQNWQMGIVLENPISFAGDPDRPSAAYLSLQPVLSYQWGTWSAGLADFEWIIDWKAGAITVPIGGVVGVDLGSVLHHFNVALSLAWNAVHPDDIGVPLWGARLGFMWIIQ